MSGTEVILHRSTDTGAPSLTGSAGSLIALLDACLVNGYNAKAVQSITRVGNVATVIFATAHGLATDGGTKYEIIGAAQAEYNGIKQISNVTSTTFDFTVTGAPTTPATGTITGRVPPLGWGKPFSGTNLAAYRSAEVTGTQMFLRVNDTGAQASYLVGYETMSDVNTGSGLFPTAAQMATGIPLDKSSTADATARPWIVVGDGFEFHLFVAHYAGAPTIFRQFHFGDPKSEMASDPYGCLIFGQSSLAPASYPEYSSHTHLVSTVAGSVATPQAGHYFARLYSQVGSAVGACKIGDVGLGGSVFGLGAMDYPSPSNNTFYVSPCYVADTSVLRGQLKGIWRPLHHRPFGNAVLIAAADSPLGRRLFTISTGNATSTPGETHVDIDGPWR